MNDPQPEPAPEQSATAEAAKVSEPKTLPLEPSAGSDQPASLMSLLAYGITVPERTVRSLSAVVGGLANESAARLIPAAFRSSRCYSVFVQQSLDMMIHDIGGVENVDGSAANEQETNLARKAVGGLLDVAGAATLHLSPMTVLAVFSDLAYGSGYYLGKLSEELKREGIIDADSSIDHVSDLIAALRDTSGTAAEAVDSPPISIDAMNKMILQLSSEIGKVDPTKLIPQREVQRLWNEMESAADQANVGLWDVSTTMTMFAMNRITLTSRGALSTINVAGSLFDEHIVGHYSDALQQISEDGLYETLATVSGPYLEAVWQNFGDDRETWTEELISGRMLGKAATTMRGWFSGDPK